MVVLPTSQAAAAGWVLVDFLRLTMRTEPAADGYAQLDVGQLDPDELWLLDRGVVQCDSTSPTTLRLYESAADPLRLLDGTPAGNFNVAEWPTSVQIAPSTSLLAVWAGASDGARGVLSLQGRIMRRG